MQEVLLRTAAALVLVASGCSSLQSSRRGPQASPADSPAPATLSKRPSDEPRPARAARVAPPGKFVRCVDHGRWECVVQTAIAAYQDAGGVSVSLVAAIHSADAAHFQTIQRELESFPLVLYEGWTEEGEDETEGPASEPVVLDLLMKFSGFADRILTVFLGFRHVGQWSGAVDYSLSTFRNVDMSFREFARLSHERFETAAQLAAAWRLFPRYVASVIIRAAPISREEWSRILSLPRDWHQACRYVYAHEVCEASNLLGAYDALPEVRRTVTIHERNALVERVLFSEIRKGKTRAAVYYGAVHMPDLERRLLERGFRKSRVRWIDAWDVGRLN